LLIGFFVLLAAGGARLQHDARHREAALDRQLDLASAYGVHCVRTGLRELVGATWRGVRAVTLDGLEWALAGCASRQWIALYGMLVGGPTLWRDGLSGIVGHALTGIVTGLVR
jgi:hypothetical protein